MVTRDPDADAAAAYASVAEVTIVCLTGDGKPVLGLGLSDQLGIAVTSAVAQLKDQALKARELMAEAAEALDGSSWSKDHGLADRIRAFLGK